MHCTGTAATHHSQTTAGTSPFGSVVLNSEARGYLCATEPVGTGIETWDGSVVFLATNEEAFVREATYISSDTELSGIDVARACCHILSFLSRAIVLQSASAALFLASKRAFRATVCTSQQARRTRCLSGSITFSGAKQSESSRRTLVTP
jgi:hypothetical protein